MPKRIASSRRSNENTARYPKKRRGVAAPLAIVPETPTCRSPALSEPGRRPGGLELLRIQHDLLAGLAELLHVLVDDTAELRLHHARGRPFAVRGEPDRADDGLHLVLVEVVCEHLVVEALRRRDRLLEHLPDRVIER